MEHRRWMNIYLVNGFDYAPETTKKKKKHSQLLDLDKMEKDEKFKKSMITNFHYDLKALFDIKGKQ